jgi:uncharacterized protein
MLKSIKTKKKFNSPSMGELDLREVIAEITKFIEQDTEKQYAIVVGTDSYTGNSVDYVTAVVVHRKGRGGKYFWQRLHKPKEPSLRHRIYQETVLSIQTAQELMEKFKAGILAKYNLEIHIDVGQAGPTREMISEVVGMVRGSGFEAKTKPDAFAATSVADRHT